MGFVDYVMLWFEVVKIFKIVEVVFYMLCVDLGVVNFKIIMVNKDYWVKLFDEVKDVLFEVVVVYCDYVVGIVMDCVEVSC